jgi:hypothetical protein
MPFKTSVVGTGVAQEIGEKWYYACTGWLSLGAVHCSTSLKYHSHKNPFLEANNRKG